MDLYFLREVEQLRSPVFVNCGEQINLTIGPFPLLPEERMDRRTVR